MGNLLGAPVTEKETHVGKTTDGLSYGTSSMQGWRIHMEDAHVCQPVLYAECDAAADVGGNGKRAKDGNTSPKRILLEDTSLFAVFDGHGGTYAAIYAAENIVKFVTRQPKFIKYAQLMEKSNNENNTNGVSGVCGNTNGSPIVGDASSKSKQDTTSTHRALRDRELLDLMEGALCDAFLELDAALFASTQNNNDSHSSNTGEDSVSDMNDNNNTTNDNPHLNDESGTTVVVVILTPRWIICANAGDSRAIYSKNNGRTIPLSYDHKPDDEEEELRVLEAGGYVYHGRVDGDLAVSRGFGDFRFKANPNLGPTLQRVIPCPDIIVQNRNKDHDEFLLIACDGIWDVNSNKECVDMVQKIFSEGETNLGVACEEVLDLCLRKGSKDNMTSLIVELPALNYGAGGGVAQRRAEFEAELESQRKEDAPIE